MKVDFAVNILIGGYQGEALLKSLVLMCLEPGYPRTDGLTPVSTELFPFNSLAMKFL